jgi:hypothetical protein
VLLVGLVGGRGSDLLEGRGGIFLYDRLLGVLVGDFVYQIPMFCCFARRSCLPLVLLHCVVPASCKYSVLVLACIVDYPTSPCLYPSSLVSPQPCTERTTYTFHGPDSMAGPGLPSHTSSLRDFAPKERFLLICNGTCMHDKRLPIPYVPLVATIVTLS